MNQLEHRREKILQGMRDGARRVFEVFLPAMGIDEANLETFMDDILPESILSREFSIDDYESVIISQREQHRATRVESTRM